MFFFAYYVLLKFDIIHYAIFCNIIFCASFANNFVFIMLFNVFITLIELIFNSFVFANESFVVFNFEIFEKKFVN